MEDIKIKIKDFEGPLDLLLHLVSQYKVDIYEVPLVSVIEQYLDYLKSMQNLELEIASDYFLMASQLMLIKSKRLLPTIAVEYEDNQLDLEEELLSQIDEYRKYKELSTELDKLHKEREKFYSKSKTEVISDDVKLLEDRNVADVFLTFSRLLQTKKKELENSQAQIKRESFSIEEKIKEVREIVELRKKVDFMDLVSNLVNVDELVTVFLASLELIKNQEITCYQESDFESIILENVS